MTINIIVHPIGVVFSIAHKIYVSILFINIKYKGSLCQIQASNVNEHNKINKAGNKDVKPT